VKWGIAVALSLGVSLAGCDHSDPTASIQAYPEPKSIQNPLPDADREKVSTGPEFTGYTIPPRSGMAYQYGKIENAIEGCMNEAYVQLMQVMFQLNLPMGAYSRTERSSGWRELRNGISYYELITDVTTGPDFLQQSHRLSARAIIAGSGMPAPAVPLRLKISSLGPGPLMSPERRYSVTGNLPWIYLKSTPVISPAPLDILPRLKAPQQSIPLIDETGIVSPYSFPTENLLLCLGQRIYGRGPMPPNRGLDNLELGRLRNTRIPAIERLIRFAGPYTNAYSFHLGDDDRNHHFRPMPLLSDPKRLPPDERALMVVHDLAHLADVHYRESNFEFSRLLKFPESGPSWADLVVKHGLNLGLFSEWRALLLTLAIYREVRDLTLPRFHKPWNRIKWVEQLLAGQRADETLEQFTLRYLMPRFSPPPGLIIDQPEVGLALERQMSLLQRGLLRPAPGSYYDILPNG